LNSTSSAENIAFCTTYSRKKCMYVCLIKGLSKKRRQEYIIKGINTVRKEYVDSNIFEMPSAKNFQNPYFSYTNTTSFLVNIMIFGFRLYRHRRSKQDRKQKISPPSSPYPLKSASSRICRMIS
ncbi:hypothetical protein L9F63_010746, partial [Diploptera punctata]